MFIIARHEARENIGAMNNLKGELGVRQHLLTAVARR
jgi:hypothetical protein